MRRVTNCTGQIVLRSSATTTATTSRKRKKRAKNSKPRSKREGNGEMAFCVTSAGAFRGTLVFHGKNIRRWSTNAYLKHRGDESYSRVHARGNFREEKYDCKTVGFGLFIRGGRACTCHARGESSADARGPPSEKDTLFRRAVWDDESVNIIEPNGSIAVYRVRRKYITRGKWP